MATFVGKVGRTLHYADTYLSLLGCWGIHVEVRTYDNAEPLVFLHQLGRVKNMDEAVDKVAAIVGRERALLALRGGEEE